MGFNIEYFKDSLGAAVAYAPVTIRLTLITFTFSVLLGIVIASIRHYRIPVLSQFFSFFVTVYMGLPVAVALVLYNLIFLTCYEGFASFFHLQKSISEINPIIIAYFALILSTTCQCCENVRGAFRSIEAVQFEAGYSIGLTKMQTLKKIILPQMVPVMIPGLINILIGTLKASNLVSIISITEVMAGALEPCGLTYSYLEGYLAAALVYWIIGAVIEWVARLIEKNSGRYRRQLFA